MSAGYWFFPRRATPRRQEPGQVGGWSRVLHLSDEPNAVLLDAAPALVGLAGLAAPPNRPAHSVYLAGFHKGIQRGGGPSQWIAKPHSVFRI